MGQIESNGATPCAIYIDMGTTNTRAWLARGDQVIARAARQAGVRDTARDGSPAKIHAAFRELVSELMELASSSSGSCCPMGIAAAGMIGSPLGLAEIPHVQAPASLADLANASRWFQFPDLAPLPVLLVPGVRCGSANPGFDSVRDADVMRGEETLCFGIHALGLVKPPAVVLNLGSHWKAIQLDSSGRIHSSITSLSGEMIHAAQTQTILASSVPDGRPTRLEQDWVTAGMNEQRRSGIARALFCVRLMELANQGSPEQRLAFLHGAFIASDLDALASNGSLLRDIPVVVTGNAVLAEAWRAALAGIMVEASVLTAEETEAALLTGLRMIFMQASQRPPSEAARPAR